MILRNRSTPIRSSTSENTTQGLNRRNTLLLSSLAGILMMMMSVQLNQFLNLFSPHLYKPTFHEKIAPYLTALVNCMYWESRFPRLITCEVSCTFEHGCIVVIFAFPRILQQMKHLHNSKSRLLAIADISADMYGSIEFTRFATKIDKPFVVYNPNKDIFSYEFVRLGFSILYFEALCLCFLGMNIISYLQLGSGRNSARIC